MTEQEPQEDGGIAGRFRDARRRIEVAFSRFGVAGAFCPGRRERGASRRSLGAGKRRNERKGVSFCPAGERFPGYTEPRSGVMGSV
jgi:hypothetical protein